MKLSALLWPAPGNVSGVMVLPTDEPRAGGDGCPGSWITVFANKTHTYMYVAGLRYDTSPLGESVDQGRAPRWRYTLRTGTGFAVRHYPGL